MKRRPCSKCGRNRAEKFFASPRSRVCVDCKRERIRNANRGRRLAETYGLTNEQYQLVYEFQGERCFICHRSPRYKMDVDHCHQTGEIRGLLCKPCNRRLLPSVRDDTAALKRAVAYLEYPPARLAFGGKTFVPTDHDASRDGA